MIPRFHLWWMIAAVAANATLSAAFYSRLPDPCPIHWNLHGQIDGYGTPFEVALLGPSVSAGVALLLIVLPLLGPFKRNFMSFRVVYGRISAVILTFFVAIQLVILLAAVGNHLRMGPLFAILIGLLFACLGNWMGKLRRNFYVGIRTPWTLANEVVWEKTHRIGGKLFVAAGLITALTGFFAGDIICFVVLMTSILGSVTWSVLYSLVVYRRLGQVDDLASETGRNS